MSRNRPPCLQSSKVSHTTLTHLLTQDCPPEDRNAHQREHRVHPLQKMSHSPDYFINLTQEGETEADYLTDPWAHLPAQLIGGHGINRNTERGDGELRQDEVEEKVVEVRPQLQWMSCQWVGHEVTMFTYISIAQEKKNHVKICCHPRGSDDNEVGEGQSKYLPGKVFFRTCGDCQLV